MFSSQGRWKGELTSRPLPEHDAELDELSDPQRAELASVWLGRAASERRVADAFEVIHRALVELRADDALISLAARGIDDEYRHEELSRLVASRFAGRELEAPPRLALVVPRHHGAPPRLLLTLHVLGHCALNETFASAFLEATATVTEGSLARAAVRELLSDEIDHARIGWAHLASLTDQQRASVAPWLLALTRDNLAMWRATPRPYPVDVALHRHGAPSAALVEQALLGAIRDLILPGFVHFGLPVGEVQAWLDAGAPTSSRP